MSKGARIRTISLAVAALGAAGLAVPSAATAGGGAAPPTVYVATGGHAGAGGTSCGSAAFASIQAAVDAAPAGATVAVCAGTYVESVTINKQLTLRGRDPINDAVINATGQPYGVGIAAAHVTVSGLTVENASDATNGPADGIITAGFVDGAPTPADYATITRTITKNNLGAGIDVNSASYTTVTGNRSVNNGIGINVSNDLGAPASHNFIARNVANNNPGGCGIVLADHSGLGVFANTVVGNVADNNGLGSPSAPDASAGSGIIIAGGGNAQVYDNSVIGNEFNGNGHGGVALHAHAPGANFSGNVIVANNIGTNNLRTDYMDTASTGIYLADASPLSIIVAGNRIHDDQVGIFTAGQVTLIAGVTNNYARVAVPVSGVPSYGG